MLIPIMFLAAVLGVVGLPLLILGSPAQFYSGMFGGAAALAGVTSGGVHWQHRWQRHWLRWPYLAGFAALGIPLESVTFPAWAALLVGVPALITLAAVLLHRGVADCPTGKAELG